MAERTRFGKKLTVNRGFILLLFLTAALIGHMVAVPHQNVRFFDSHELFSYSEGWTLTCSSGVYSDVTLPAKGEYKNTDETVYLENILPKELPTGAVLLTRSSLQSIVVYVDNTEIYSYGIKYAPPMGKSNGSIWNIITLPKEVQGKSVKIVITSPYKTFREQFNDCFIGTFKGAIGYLFHEYIVSFVIIMLELVVSVLLFFMYLVMRISGSPVSKKILYVAEIGFFSACWLFTECKLTQVFIGNMAGFSGAGFTILALVMIPPLFYVDELEKKTYHRFIAPMIALLEMNATVQIIFQTVGVADFYTMVPITHIIMGTSALVAIITAVHRFVTLRSHEMIVVIFVSIFMGVAAACEIIISYLTGYVSGGILEVCVLFTFTLAMAESINETVKMIQESKKAVSENIAKTTFLAKISHEIRTPMNAICAMSDLMEKSDELSKNNQDAVKTIHSSALNLLDIINELLDYSKISTGKFEIQEEVYELSRIVLDVKSVIGVRASEKGLDFDVTVSPDLPVKMGGDAGRIIQILINLLGNAVKYTPVGRVSLDITGTKLPAGYIKLYMTVKDTGIGIKEEDKDKLFEPFRMGTDSKKGYVEGTGLGLTVTKQLANLMGGSVDFESEYGSGSTFTATVVQTIESADTFRSSFLRLIDEEKKTLFLAEGDYAFTGSIQAVLDKAGIPYELIKRGMLEISDYGTKAGILLAGSSEYKKIATESFANNHQNLEMTVVAGSLEQIKVLEGTNIIRAPFTVCDCLRLFTEDRSAKEEIFFDASGATVMVVDDNVVNLKVMNAALKRFGIKPTLISNGKQALDAALSKKYDLIFMDHMMPEMDGIETTLRIRKSKSELTKDVKIVALTANASSGIEKMFEEKGFDGFLSKPVSVESIAKVLRASLPKEAYAMKA